MNIFKPRAQRKLTCPNCPRQVQVVGVCDFATDQFQGCGDPYCLDHGLPVEGFSQVSLESERKEEQKEASLRQHAIRILQLSGDSSKEFRGCYSCILQIPKKARHRILTSCFAILLPVALLFVAVVLIAVKRSSEIICDPDSLLSEYLSTCLVKTEQPIGHGYLKWLEYNNPEATDCKSRFISNKVLECMCPPPFGGYLSVVLDSLGRSRKKWELTKCPQATDVDCPPDRIRFISSFGKCRHFSYASQSFSSQYAIIPKNAPPSEDPPLCPFMTRFIDGVCVESLCFQPGFITSIERQECENCPPFTSTSSPLTCAEVRYYPDSAASVDWFPWSATKEQPCPPDEGPSEAQIELLVTRGYYYRRTHLQYRVCPVVVKRSQSTWVCSPSEMLIRHIIKCQSPCARCSEKWHYSLRRCVPADTCPQFSSHYLLSTGECRGYSDYELSVDSFDDLSNGISVCQKKKNSSFNS